MTQRERITIRLLWGHQSRVVDIEQCDDACCGEYLEKMAPYRMCEFCGDLIASGRFVTEANGTVRCMDVAPCRYRCSG